MLLLALCMHFLRGNVPLDASRYAVEIFQNIPEACGVVEGAKQSILSVIGVLAFLYFYLEPQHTSS